MFSPQLKGGSNADKKSGPVSSWFSSLRRTPKNKKSLANSKPLQKSCIDLSSSDTRFYATLESDFDASKDPLIPVELQKATSLPPETPSHSSSASSSSTTSSGICSSCCQFTTISKQSETKLLSTKDELQTAGIDDKGDKLYYFTKKQNVKKVTTTTITRTTVINKQNRIGYVLATNDDGGINDLSHLSPQIDLRRLLDCDDQLRQQHCACDAASKSLTALSSTVVAPPPAYSCSSSSRSSNNVETVVPKANDRPNPLDDSLLEFIDSGNGSEIYSDRECTHKSCKHCQCKNKFKSAPELNFESNTEQIKDELMEVTAELVVHETQDDGKSSSRARQMTMGRKKFNMDPKKGIEFLVKNDLLRMDPQDVAQFLYKGEGLNKTAIGDYLGERNEFNEQVLKAFVELHDFTNLILVQGLRQFLWSFRLPGEAQKIDRMMECFAQRYCQLNPDIFTKTDTCYVLSFAIIMLNTSLHNPSVKDKPTVEQFILMNRGINNGGDLPRELLESLYESIKTEPFKIPKDDGNDLMHTFFNPDKEGWLLKQGGRYKSWKRRWFILNDNCLYYFEYTTDKEPRGIIPLENIKVRAVQDRSKPHCFELYATGDNIIKACKTDSEGKVVEGKHTVYRMSASSEEEKDEWVKCLNTSISTNPFYDILVLRKKMAFTYNS